MNIREISDVFKDTASGITALKSYNFGWASDRVRQGNTEDFQELNEFPRVFFSVPTITGSDQTRKQDTYQVTLFFDDLLGYDNEGDEDPTLQIDKWANLQQYANYFVQRLNKIKQSILPNYLFIPEAPSITFDSFTGLQRMITVQLSFNLVVPTNCDPGIITLVQCIANIVTSSNLTASLTTVLKFAASLEARATVTADINFVQKVASSLNANALLGGDISFVQKAQASLLTSASVTGNITIPKTFNASLLATGTTTADLTVQAAASLLLDLYPNAGAAYSLRKLRAAYSGSAIRVRRSSDNTEQDIGFDVNGNLDTTALTTFVGAGNGFVTTWYDQSGNTRNATQTTQSSQLFIMQSGVLNTLNSKPIITNPNINILRFFNTPMSTLQNVPVSIITAGKLNQLPTNSFGNVCFYLGANDIGNGGNGRFAKLVNTTEYVSSLRDISNNVTILPVSTYNLNPFIHQSYFTSTNIIGRFNGNDSSINHSITNFYNTASNFTLFARSNSSLFSGNISFYEFVFYFNDKSSDKVGIGNNINTHYGIY
jgi:hypothetical protein